MKIIKRKFISRYIRWIPKIWYLRENKLNKLPATLCLHWLKGYIGIQFELTK